MTIAAAYLTSEGVVIGADSTTTVTVASGVAGSPSVVQLLNHAQKVFEIGGPGGSRFALCTWNAGSVGNVAHRTIAARLSDTIAPATTVKEAAQNIAMVVAAAKSESDLAGVPTGDFGYFLGGINPGTHVPECIRLEFVGGAPKGEQHMAVGEARFEGAPELFIRAYHGCDPKFVEVLGQELKTQLGAAGVPNLDAIILAAVTKASQSIPKGGFNDMPIREAIDFIHMYLHLTIKGFKFRFGPPVCGGPIEIGFVTTDRPFRWARHKKFDSAINQEDTVIS